MFVHVFQSDGVRGLYRGVSLLCRFLLPPQSSDMSALPAAFRVHPPPVDVQYHSIRRIRGTERCVHLGTLKALLHHACRNGIHLRLPRRNRWQPSRCPERPHAARCRSPSRRTTELQTCNRRPRADDARRRYGKLVERGVAEQPKSCADDGEPAGLVRHLQKATNGAYINEGQPHDAL